MYILYPEVTLEYCKLRDSLWHHLEGNDLKKLIAMQDCEQRCLVSILVITKKIDIILGYGINMDQ